MSLEVPASFLADNVTLMVNTYQEEHNCIRPVDNHNINHTSAWIANKLKSSLRANLDMSYDLMLNELRKK